MIGQPASCSGMGGGGGGTNSIGGGGVQHTVCVPDNTTREDFEKKGKNIYIHI